MGLANWLTVLRILLIPVFVSLLVYRKPGLALLVFGAAALTDLLDGYVARRHGLQSRLGAFLDPMADKLLLVSSFVTLTWLKTLPFWIISVCTIIVLVTATKIAHEAAREWHLGNLERIIFVAGAYFTANCLTFLTRFVLFHYVLFADRRGPRAAKLASSLTDESGAELPLAEDVAAAVDPAPFALATGPAAGRSPVPEASETYPRR